MSDIAAERLSRAVIPLCVLLALGACGHPDQPTDSVLLPASPWPFAEPVDATISGSTSAGDSLAGAPAKVIEAIATRDFAELAKWVHPTEGLRFSPYAYVDKQKDVVLDSDTLRSAQNSSQSYLWGYADGTGDPMEMTIAEYFDRVVYAADFSRAPQVSFDRTIGRGNSINNAGDVYSDAIIVEYHFPAIDKELAGLDWQSLRLIFRNQDEQWYLCGIVRDVWTI